MELIKELKKLNCGQVIESPRMREYTTYKVGGPASAIIIPRNERELIKTIKFLRKNDIKWKILGNGSNLLFSEKGYDGVLIKLDKFDSISINRNEVVVGAGYNLVKLAMKACRYSLSGLEFAAGIPGTIGGAVFMNAGAYKSDMGYIVKEVKVLTPEFEIITIKNKDMDFHYRTSFLQKNPGYICLEATLKLAKGNKDLILEVINDRKKRRMESQPLEYPSAGSVFRNPEGDFAGRLIEEIGYKGKCIGDAMVSEKHANFIVNKGNASGDDVRALIKDIQKVIKEKYDIELKCEQEFVE